jgi:hypothetical protein
VRPVNSCSNLFWPETLDLTTYVHGNWHKFSKSVKAEICYILHNSGFTSDTSVITVVLNAKGTSSNCHTYFFWK